MNDNLIKIIEAKLLSKIKITKETKILIAFSGGADSVFLLLAMKKISEIQGFKIGAAHLNHCIRGQEALRDKIFCKEFAFKNNISFHYRERDIKNISKKLKLSLEDAGRKERYSFFSCLMNEKGYSHTVTAHHKDDNIEQVLMNIIRGTGLKGLCGIPEKRGRIIRPMLDIEKNMITAYLDENHIEYCTDKTNLDTFFLRNKIRNILIPELERNYNPALKKSISRLSGICREENNFIDNYCESLLKKIVAFKENKAFIELNILKKENVGVQKRIIIKAINKLKGNTLKISSVHIDKIIELSNSSELKEFHLPDKIVVWKYFDSMEIFISKFNPRQKKFNKTSFFYEEIKKCPEKKLSIKYKPEIIFEILCEQESSSSIKNNEEIRLNAEKVEFPIILRNIKNGDRFSPENFNGRKKIKKILSEKKLSPAMKKDTIVLEYCGKIIWIAGIAVNNSEIKPEKNKKTIVIKKVCG
ncbi:MAG: tRNA lysidine(34) synthetase TilS [Deltaproteobacteria bacterium]|nr:MAG: tRNA lysidine(34) synthetase TilS [Deltaproteobacteria bacterium]